MMMLDVQMCKYADERPVFKRCLNYASINQNIIPTFEIRTSEICTSNYIPV